MVYSTVTRLIARTRKKRTDQQQPVWSGVAPVTVMREEHTQTCDHTHQHQSSVQLNTANNTLLHKDTYVLRLRFWVYLHVSINSRTQILS